MDTKNFIYHLPKGLIAQSPKKPRDRSRLMVINRKTGEISHRIFSEIEEMLGPNDILVLNKTKVYPARLFAKKTTGGSVELLFIEETKPGIWEVLTRPGLKTGGQIAFKKHLFDVVGKDGITTLINTKMDSDSVINLLQRSGHTPLPPYIKSGTSEKKLRTEYQTVFAQETGSVAAPTAGFHFTRRLLNKLKKKGVKVEYITLHVGLGTFAPIKAKKLEDHPMHFERYEIDKLCAKRLKLAKNKGKRIIAVGTTSARALETYATKRELKGSTNLFIYPPYKFRFVDALITNFHLPSSTLLALVSAFVSFPNTKIGFRSFQVSLMGKAYSEAVKRKYRFYSFGDACFII